MKFKIGEKIKYIVSYNLWEDKVIYMQQVVQKICIRLLVSVFKETYAIPKVLTTYIYYSEYHI